MDIPEFLIDFFNDTLIALTNPTLFLCPSPSSHYADSVSQHSVCAGSKEWAALLRCQQCQTSWLVCSCCSGLVSFTTTAAKRHAKRKKHLANMALVVATRQQSRNAGIDISTTEEEITYPCDGFNDPQIAPTINPVDDDDNHAFHYDDDHPMIDCECITPSQPVERLTYQNFATIATLDQLKLSTMSPASQRYFMSEVDASGTAIQHLVGRAFSRSERSDRRSTKEEAAYHLQSAMFCNSLKHEQMHAYSGLLATLVPALLGSVQHPNVVNSPSNQFFKTTHQPTKAAEVDLYYLSGKHSIWSNIPYPSVTEAHGHAYVSILEIVEHFLAHGMDFDEIALFGSTYEHDGNNHTVRSVPETVRANEIRQKVRRTYASTTPKVGDGVTIVPLILYMIVWSDDFQPNATKANRQSVWIKTVTICLPYRKESHVEYTYAVAVGRKGENHEPIKQMFQDELESSLAASVGRPPLYAYCGKLNRTIPVVVEILCTIQDRPERCAMNKVLTFAGSATRRWLFSAFLPDPNKLRSCQSCYVRRLKRLVCSLPSATRINEVIEPGHHNMGVCEECQVCADFDYECTNGTLDSTKPLNYPTQEDADSPPAPTGRQVIDQVKLPPVRQTFEFFKQGAEYCFHNVETKKWNKQEAACYLNALGINNDCANKMINDAILARTANNGNGHQYQGGVNLPGCWTDGTSSLRDSIDTPMHQVFQGCVKSLIDLISKWLKHGTGGLSKHKAFGDSTRDEISQVQRLQLDWIRIWPFCHSAESRDYTTGGWVGENYLAFARLFKVMYGGYVRPLFDGAQARGISEFEKLVTVTVAMISRIMSKEVNTSSVQEMDDYIRMFLCCTDDFDKAANPNRKEPMWLKKGNFLSMLNFPDVAARFGPIPLYWDGNREKYIQLVKPLMKGVRETSSYLKTKLTQVHQKAAMAQLIWTLPDDLLMTQTKLYLRYTSIHCYTERVDVADDIAHGRPISGFAWIRNKETNIATVLVCIKDGLGSIIFEEVIFDDSDGVMNCGLWHAPITLTTFNQSSDNVNLSTLEDMDQVVFTYVVLTSLSLINNDNCMRYCLFCKNWHERNNTGVLALPSIDDSIFPEGTL